MRNFLGILVTVEAQFTTKGTNSEKVIYLLSLISYSKNKLKFQKIFFFRFYVKQHDGDDWVGGGDGLVLPCPLIPVFAALMVILLF